MSSDRNVADRRAELSPAQRAWLDERIRAAGPVTGADGAIPRRHDQAAPVPLSPAQQRLWFLETLHPGTSVHTVPVALRLEGGLDVPALERSLAEIGRRHEALRTCVVEVDGEPVQVVCVRPETAFELPVERFKNRLREAFGGHVEEYIRLRTLEEVRRPFDLAAGPLFRARLLRLDRRDHVLILTAHHLVVDGWSLGVIFRELGALYAAFAGGAPTPLAEPPIQYADYAMWQHERLRRGAFDGEIAYWTRHLAGLEPTRLAMMTSRPGEGAARGGRRQVTIPPPLAERLRELARREGATLYMALLAVFQALLARYTDRDDVAVASPIAGRARLETENVVGFFVNTLVLRTDVGDDPTFRALLARVRAVALDAFAHQEAPFERVVAAVRPERGGVRAPLVSVAFALHNTPRAPLDLPGLSISRLDVEPEEAPFDLSLGVRATDGGLQGWLDYDAGAFDADAIDRFAGHFRTLLNGAVGDPDRALSALPVLTPPERHQLLVEWNVPLRPIPERLTIHGLFEAQAARAPEAVAVVGADVTLTYGELNRRANRLAHRLRRLGVGRDVVVGLCLEPSSALIVGMVAILKAGGAYLPLDPADPPARLASLLSEARAPVVVARAGQDLGPPAAGRHRLELTDDPPCPDEPDGNPDNATGANDLAYVISTSGSSGRPKGVMVPHRAVVRLVIDSDYVRLTPDDVVAQAANPAFDATTFEVWGTFLNGARLVLLSRPAVLSPPDLAAALARHGVGTLFLTTALFNLLARDAPTALRGVRQVLFGGEAVDPAAVAAVLEHGPPDRLIHVYGPTETTTFATWHPVERVEPGATTIPIGRPIANTSVQVLDRHRRLVPIGVPGELYIGGPGVARGYLHQPRLSAERFLPDPFVADPEARRFRTGDRVRWRPDGPLEFLGRFDDQVKLRGFRVEPGEVEAAMARHPAVAEAAAVVRDDAPGGKELVAYIVPAAGLMPTASGLRAFAKAALPAFMVPAAFVPLDALPMTPNGKVDRRALPAPNGQSGAADAYVPPRTATQETLVGIWAELLGLERVGIQDDFFDLGGHSLLVARMVARVAAEFGRDLPVRALFEAPTIAELAERVEAAPPVGAGDERSVEAVTPALVPLQEGGGRRPLFFVPGGVAGGQNLFRLTMLARRLGPDQPVYGFLESGRLADDEETSQASIEATAAACRREVERIQPEGPYLLGGVCIGGVLAYEMARQLVARGQEVAALFLLDTRYPDRDAEAIEWLRRRLRERPASRAARSGDRLQGDPDGTPARAVDDDGDDQGRIGRTPELTDEEEMLLDEDSNPRALQFYRYRPRPFAGRITLFENEAWHRDHPDSEWAAVATGGLEVEVVPGDHRTYLVEHLDVVADRLRARLDALTVAGPGG